MDRDELRDTAIVLAGGVVGVEISRRLLIRKLERRNLRRALTRGPEPKFPSPPGGGSFPGWNDGGQGSSPVYPPKIPGPPNAGGPTEAPGYRTDGSGQISYDPVWRHGQNNPPQS